MKYKYTIIDCRDNGKKFKKIKLPIELSPIEVMLDDMQGLSSPIFIEPINEVLSGKADFQQLGGNMVDLEINKDFTTVCNLFPRDEEVECIIETEELLKIIELWVDINSDLLRDFN